MTAVQRNTPSLQGVASGGQGRPAGGFDGRSFVARIAIVRSVDVEQAVGAALHMHHSLPGAGEDPTASGEYEGARACRRRVPDSCGRRSDGDVFV
jgi:hypothetical protein